MAEVEIIDTEIIPHPLQAYSLASTIKHQSKVKEGDAGFLNSLAPVYTQADREAALRLLLPSPDDVVLGAGWVEPKASSISSEEDGSGSSVDSPRRASSASSSSSFSTPSTPTGFSSRSQTPEWTASIMHTGLSDVLFVRSCSQGWLLSFELSPYQPIPAPRASDEILIRNHAVGLNPVDWKSVSFNFGIPAFPWILGRDIAGTIVQPPADNAEGWKVGDRVWTCADSREIRAGGYQRFSVHKKGTLAKIPESIGDQEAATLGTGLITAAVALFAFFKLPLAPLRERGLVEKLENVRIVEDSQEADWVLVYGGGAVTGIYTSQLARISNLRVMSIASESNFDYLRSIGVTAVIDRHQPSESILSSISLVLSQQGGKLKYAMDCVSSSTADHCLQALKDNGTQEPELICLSGNPKLDLGHIKLHKISFSTTFYHPDGEFAKDCLAYLTESLESGRLKPCRPEVLPDGLAGIRSGLELLREGKAPRARKLVVRVQDTPAADVTYLGVRTELGWNGVV